MGDYWDTYGSDGAWCDQFGNHVDPRTFPDEDALSAAGYRYIDQGRDPIGWVARELGDVEARQRGPMCATECDVAVRNAIQRQYESGMWLDRVHAVAWEGVVPVDGPRRFTDGTLCIPVESLGRE